MQKLVALGGKLFVYSDVSCLDTVISCESQSPSLLYSNKDNKNQSEVLETEYELCEDRAAT